MHLTIWHIYHILKGEKCREDFEMGPFVVEFYETRDGQRPAEDFLEREGESDENTGSVFE